MSKEKELLIAKEHQFLQSTKISRLKKLSIAGSIIFLMILVVIIYYYNKIRNDELYDYANNNIQLNIDSTSAYSDTLSGKTGSFSTPGYSDTLSSNRGNKALDSLDNTYKTEKVRYKKDIEQLQNELDQSQDAHSKLKLLLDKNYITIKQLQSENENYKKQIGILRPKSSKSDY